MMEGSGVVVVGMSGGVDSAVSALLLKEAGFTPIGVTLLMWGDGNVAADAEPVCRQLGIEHRVLDLRERFIQAVIEPFADEYSAGRTPNPCVVCNRHVKFRALWEEAKAMGASVATGHYARVQQRDGQSLLQKATCASKDQSYVLWGLPRELLGKLYLPLGEYSKEQVRQKAAAAGLICAKKADSQDICFVPDGDYAAFLERLHPGSNPSGRLIDEQGREYGPHRGLWHYTVGQRKGLGRSFGRPVYVKAIDSATGDVMLSEEAALYRKELTVSHLNWHDRETLESPESFNIKLRYSAPEIPGTLFPTENGVQVKLEHPHRAVTPGQSAVFYRGDTLCGGAKIVASL